MEKQEHTYTLPTGITSITKSTLDEIREQKQIQHVIIPQGVTSIEDGAFAYSFNLISITIPNSVTRIADAVFKGCVSLTSIHIPNEVTSIGKQAFYFCTGLTSINIPDGVKRIRERAFCGCSNLTSINIPNGVKSIEADAFNSCSKLTSITIPDSVTSIGRLAFLRCTNLTSINIPNGVKSIEADAFNGCSKLTSITIPDRVSEIRMSAFQNCKSLTSITIPDGVKIIRHWAFQGCSSLTSITIPDRVTSIGECAFEGCSNLAYFTIPDSVTEIEPRAFQNCTRLKLIILPNHLKNKDINYWLNRGIIKDKIQLIDLIDSQTISIWAKDKKLSNTHSYHELAILYQLQKDDNFTPSWPELGKLAPNLLMGDLLEVLPEEKKDIVLPKIYKNLPINMCLESHSLFSVAPTELRQEESDYLKKDGFEEHKALNDSTKTIQLSEVNPAVSGAILKWLTLKEVATLLRTKASSELRPTYASKDDPLTTHKTRYVMQG